MAKFAINTLEFTKVREKLSQYAGTAMGQRLAMELMSSSRFEGGQAFSGRNCGSGPHPR